VIGDSLKKAAALEPISASLTFDGVTNLIQDIKRKFGWTPKAIVLSYRDRRSLNCDTMGQSTTPVLLADQNKDDMCIAYVEGVMVGWNRNVRDGHCVIIPNEQGSGIHSRPLVDKEDEWPSKTEPQKQNSDLLIH
jgi:hypothetical protein